MTWHLRFLFQGLSYWQTLCTCETQGEHKLLWLLSSDLIHNLLLTFQAQQCRTKLTLRLVITLGKNLVANTSSRLAGLNNGIIGKMQKDSLQNCDMGQQNAPPRSVGLQITIPAPLTTARRLSSDHAIAPPETGAAYNPQTSTVGHIRCQFLYPHCIKPVHNAALLA